MISIAIEYGVAYNIKRKTRYDDKIPKINTQTHEFCDY